MQKSALITGITGQDGSYLAELLLGKGYKVFGLVQRSATDPFDNIRHILDKIEIVVGDMSDSSSLLRAMQLAQPDEVYNLAAQSFVRSSWDLPIMTGDVTGVGVTRMLEAVKEVKPKARFYQASSSEMFGKVVETPQKETTPFHPRSPYGVAKVYGHWITVNYRESYGMFACSGILFNHEGPRRGYEFVTQKIASTAAYIKEGLAKELRLGNMDAKRDWGFAGDYVEAMWLMLQQNEPDDFVIGTGETHSVQEFVELAFEHVGLPWQDYVTQDKRYMRPAEVDMLLADPSKAKNKLGWEPKVKFPELVKMMVDAALEKIAKTRAGEVPKLPVA
ncbi:MAG: GDP-mannose 4,6-dehydratase [Candidatus Andersenbacteria bacterium]|nr:GDP-mannose 4,6-dehydratase [bacterium]MDZ4225503.1 GDP-mannose 4,6-dehydratase [Candidatus Andersenbacteria bacterium]